TRFAFAGYGSVLSTPPAAAARDASCPSSEASATVPTPWAALPRKARRVIPARRIGSMSGPRNRFVKVEQHARDVCPGGKLGGIDAFGHGGVTDFEQLARRLRIRAIDAELL